MTTDTWKTKDRPRCCFCADAIFPGREMCNTCFALSASGNRDLLPTSVHADMLARLEMLRAGTAGRPPYMRAAALDGFLAGLSADELARLPQQIAAATLQAALGRLLLRMAHKRAPSTEKGPP